MVNGCDDDDDDDDNDDDNNCHEVFLFLHDCYCTPFQIMRKKKTANKLLY